MYAGDRMAERWMPGKLLIRDPSKGSRLLSILLLSGVLLVLLIAETGAIHGHHYEYNDELDVDVQDNVFKTQVRRRRSTVRWVAANQLTPGEITSLQDGWLLFDQACDQTAHQKATSLFFNNFNTTETVQALQKPGSKTGVCNFMTKHLFCSVLIGKCVCRRGALLQNGECKRVEGAFDCDKHWYDYQFMDNPLLDNRAGLLGGINCVTGSTCVRDDTLRPDINSQQVIYICKPDVRGQFPGAKDLMLDLTRRIKDNSQWIKRGMKCKKHLNPHSSVSSHTFIKQQTIEIYSSTIAELKWKCNVFKNEECHLKRKVCECANGFANQSGICRLSSSNKLTEEERKCEWEVWPTFVSTRLLFKIHSITYNAES
jgi:hypothetical protein